MGKRNVSKSIHLGKEITRRNYLWPRILPLKSHFLENHTDITLTHKTFVKN